VLQRRRFFPRLAPAVVVSRRRPIVLSLAALGAAGLMLLLLAVLLSRPSGVDPARARAVQPLAVEASGCRDIDARAAHVRDLLSSGQLAAAMSAADDGLTRPAGPGCASAQLALTRLWYAANLDDLVATTVDDAALARQAPVRWATIERRADQLGLPSEERHPPMTLAQTAYDRGLWQLADAAFREAWADGQIGVGGVEFRHALLRNWGHRLATGGPAPDKVQGLALLATAHAIAQSYGLQTNVACTDLRALGVADCAKTNPDPNEPTLAGPRRAGSP
jgi:hypothetical protein